MHRQPRTPVLLLALVLCGLIASGLAPKDRLTWFLEILPIVIVLPVLIAAYHRHPLTPLLYRLLALHAAVLIVGGYYTYAEVPAGRWVQEAFGLARNHYDRFGHLIQGFVPAMVMREWLLKTSPLRPGRWLFFLVCSTALALSALYELFEWRVAIALGQSAEEFLGTQGDEWDTQWDMGMALIGAITAQLTLAPLHDRQLQTQTDAAGGSGVPLPCRKSAMTCIAIILLMPVSAGAAPYFAGTSAETQLQFGQSPLRHERLGLFDGEAFTMTTGRCAGCPAPPQALWYFADETIAIPVKPFLQNCA